MPSFPSSSLTTSACPSHAAHVKRSSLIILEIDLGARCAQAVAWSPQHSLCMRPVKALFDHHYPWYWARCRYGQARAWSAQHWPLYAASEKGCSTINILEIKLDVVLLEQQLDHLSMALCMQPAKTPSDLDHPWNNDSKSQYMVQRSLWFGIIRRPDRRS